MKITVQIDVTPEEARRFFGLPDVGPLQEKMMDRMEAQMDAFSDPAYLGKLASQLVVGGVQSVDAMGRAFTDAMTGSSRRKKDAANDTDAKKTGP